MFSDHLKKQIIRHEGMRLKPYKDVTGHLTIGVGRNLDANGITEEEALLMLDHDLLKAKEDMRSLLDEFEVASWSLRIERQEALVNFVFNVGKGTAKQFKKMWTALKTYDYNEAAEQLLYSMYAKQVGQRAIELAEQLRTGVRA